jgi:UDP-N-acetylmuramate--alanine ligase
MIAHILVKAGLDPTFVIGTKPGWRLGQGKYLVIEADDYKAKFLCYEPNILVLTNIEEEHMDFFSDLSHILRVFSQYMGQVKDYIVANRDDNNVVSVLEGKNLKARSVFYSLKDQEAGDLKKILQVPGQHNVSNALAALNVARILKISDEVALGALSEYKGVWRRFECKKIVINGVEHEIVSDYAHHPTEIMATLQAVGERFSGREVWLVFQPHQYQRTFYLFDDFTKALSEARDGFGINKLIITDIYDVAGREDETIKDRVNSQKLVANIGQSWAIYLPKDQLKGYLMENLPKDAVLIIMGAGDVYKLADELSI